jgi:hypothetical protein
MNAAEAKRLLEVRRPGGADDLDPRLREALQIAEQDPELSAWLEEQHGFDLRLARSLKTIAAPAELKAQLLASRDQPHREAVRPPVPAPVPARALRSGSFLTSFPSSWRDWRAGAAAAAIVLALTVGGAFAAHRKPVRFADLRKELVNEAWVGESHLEFKSTDLDAIRRWLAAHGLPDQVALPAGLREMHLHGCQVMNADGHRIPMLCLGDGSRHLHLFIVPSAQLVGLPPQGTPDFEKYGSWKTAAWRQGDRTYILSGMKTQAFLAKFRKAGRWTMSG